MKDGNGWIKIHRKLQDNPNYFSEPFCRNMAWIDMLILANHTENSFRCRGISVKIRRGQIGYGIEKLAKRWRWSRGKTERWFLELETEKQIVRQKNNVTTLITIVNYDKYQIDDKANNNANDKANGQQTVKQTDINKNEENNKNSIVRLNSEKNEKSERDNFSGEEIYASRYRNGSPSTYLRAENDF